MRPKILLLEDDSAIAGTVAFALEREGFAVVHALLLRDADRQARRERPAAAILDVGLPDGNGLDLCRCWRADPSFATLPTLMLTARGEEIDRVLGLEAGADDYLSKPFSPRELVARVRALLRRATMPKAAPATDGLLLDEAGHRVLFAGQALPLTRLEYRLLRDLLLARGRILSREALLQSAWGADSEAADRTVDTHIKTLRAKLRDAGPAADGIATHRGVGYAWAPVSPGPLPTD
ncbi:MAG: winged helix-turn-helix domain-containing protein [Rubrivivax sp.]|nr:winged helix-turn-helix domain-containing protein [Rubrivivax sp.]